MTVTRRAFIGSAVAAAAGSAVPAAFGGARGSLRLVVWRDRLPSPRPFLTLGAGLGSIMGTAALPDGTRSVVAATDDAHVPEELDGVALDAGLYHAGRVEIAPERFVSLLPYTSGATTTIVHCDTEEDDEAEVERAVVALLQASGRHVTVLGSPCRARLAATSGADLTIAMLPPSDGHDDGECRPCDLNLWRFVEMLERFGRDDDNLGTHHGAVDAALRQATAGAFLRRRAGYCLSGVIGSGS